MKIKLLILSFIVLCLSAIPAVAATFGDGGAGLQGVLDGITKLPIPGDSSVNVLTDEEPDTHDSYWGVTATGTSASTLIVELASFATTNTFGVYDMTNPAIKVQIFDGAAAAGAQAAISIKDDGSIFLNFSDTGTDFAGNSFGFYLDASIGNARKDTSGNPIPTIFYSDTSLNQDTLDHMYAYFGTNTDTVKLPGIAQALWTDSEVILAFEDLYGPYSATPQAGFTSDRDFTDFVVMVESVVPVPGAILLGILGLGVAGLKLRKFA